MEDINILLNLNALYKSLTDVNEKRTIKRLIDKRPMPFLIDQKIILPESVLGQGRIFINQIFNIKINDLFEDSPDEERYSHHINYQIKNHWLHLDNDYKELTLIRAQFYLKENTKLKKEGLKLLNIYTEQRVELIIKKHFKL